MNKIVILFADIHDSICDLQASMKQEWESKDSIAYLEKTIQKLGYKTILVEPKIYFSDLQKFLNRDLKNLDFKKNQIIFFNLVEGFLSRNRESYIPAIAEFLGFPHTGSDAYSQAITLDKNISKMIAKTLGIPVKPHFILSNKKQLHQMKISNPLFWKPNGEGSGISIGENNILRKAQDLKGLEKKILRHEKIIVEEFLPGNEYTLGVIGNFGKYKITKAARVEYAGSVYGSKIKTKSKMPEKLVFDVEKKIEKKMQKYSLDFSEAIKVSGYGRYDFRCDNFGNPYFLEANLTCGLSYKYSTFPILYRESFGKNYSELIKLILDSALNEYKNKRFKYGRLKNYSM